MFPTALENCCLKLPFLPFKILRSSLSSSLCIARLLGTGSSTIFVSLWKRQLPFLEPIRVLHASLCPSATLSLCCHWPADRILCHDIRFLKVVFTHSPKSLQHISNSALGSQQDNKIHSVNSCPSHRPHPSICQTFVKNGATNNPKCFRCGNPTLTNLLCHSLSFQDAWSIVPRECKGNQEKGRGCATQQR